MVEKSSNHLPWTQSEITYPHLHYFFLKLELNSWRQNWLSWMFVLHRTWQHSFYGKSFVPSLFFLIVFKRVLFTLLSLFLRPFLSLFLPLFLFSDRSDCKECLWNRLCSYGMKDWSSVPNSGFILSASVKPTRSSVSFELELLSYKQLRSFCMLEHVMWIFYLLNYFS